MSTMMTSIKEELTPTHIEAGDSYYYSECIIVA